MNAKKEPQGLFGQSEIQEVADQALALVACIDDNDPAPVRDSVDWIAKRLDSFVSRCTLESTPQVCPHCKLPAVMPDVCTPELNEIIQGHIQADGALVDLSVDISKRLAESTPKPSAWQSLDSAPRNREVFFWIVPKTADECVTDTSGKPIVVNHQPYRKECKWGCWGACSKPSAWMEPPLSPHSEASHQAQEPPQ